MNSSSGRQPPQPSMVHANSLDTRLLQIFMAVLAEKNVSRAAERLGISQSAVSKGLSQLRHILGDALFLRTPSGVVPTHRALDIAGDVDRALRALESLARTERAFDPATTETEFHVGATDYVAFVLLPALVEAASTLAPRLRIVVHDIETIGAEDMLLAGKVDLVLSPPTELAFPLHHQALFHDEYVCAMRQSHPLAETALTVESFISARHLAIPRQHGGRERTLTKTLQQLGLERDVGVSLPHLLAAPQTLIMTDLIATLGRRVATAFSKVHPIKMLRHPIELGVFEIHQLWHDRTHSSRSHQWMRELVGSVSKTI